MVIDHAVFGSGAAILVAEIPIQTSTSNPICRKLTPMFIIVNFYYWSNSRFCHEWLRARISATAIPCHCYRVSDRHMLSEPEIQTKITNMWYRIDRVAGTSKHRPAQNSQKDTTPATRCYTVATTLIKIRAKFPIFSRLDWDCTSQSTMTNTRVVSISKNNSVH